MNNNHSLTVFNRNMVFICLLAAIFGGFFEFHEPAKMQSDAPPVLDSQAKPEALGKLAFQRMNIFVSGSAATSLMSVNSDGTGETTLVAAQTPPLYCGEPAWSPDGAKIAYVQDSDIYIINADGSNKINITNNGLNVDERNPSWSATNKIAYQRSSQIWTMNTDGTNQTQFAAISQPSPAAPAWSPDGAKIIFGKGGSGIAVINLDGTNDINLTNGAQDGKRFMVERRNENRVRAARHCGKRHLRDGRERRESNQNCRRCFDSARQK